MTVRAVYVRVVVDEVLSTINSKRLRIFEFLPVIAVFDSKEYDPAQKYFLDVGASALGLCMYVSRDKDCIGIL